MADKIKKITYGFVVQTFDPNTNTWVSQEFIAGDQVQYEDEFGEAIFDDELGEIEGKTLNFDMVQPVAETAPVKKRPSKRK